MNAFEDLEKRTWKPKITLRVIERFEEEAGICLLDAVFNFLKGFESFEKIEVKLPVVIEALSSILKGKLKNVMTLAYLSVENQARERNVSREDFSELVGDADTAPKMFSAVGGAYGDFFLKMIEEVKKPEKS